MKKTFIHWEKYKVILKVKDLVVTHYMAYTANKNLFYALRELGYTFFLKPWDKRILSIDKMDDFDYKVKEEEKYIKSTEITEINILLPSEPNTSSFDTADFNYFIRTIEKELFSLKNYLKENNYKVWARKEEALTLYRMFKAQTQRLNDHIKNRNEKSCRISLKLLEKIEEAIEVHKNNNDFFIKNNELSKLQEQYIIEVAKVKESYNWITSTDLLKYDMATDLHKDIYKYLEDQTNRNYKQSILDYIDSISLKNTEYKDLLMDLYHWYNHQKKDYLLKALNSPLSKKILQKLKK